MEEPAQVVVQSSRPHRNPANIEPPMPSAALWMGAERRWDRENRHP